MTTETCPTIDCCLPDPFEYQITVPAIEEGFIMGEGGELVVSEGGETMPE